MARRLFIALSVVCTLAAPTAASACSPIPFDLHVFMATRALQSTELEPAKRDEAERWLAAARDGKGPRWHGERQQALNKALVVLSLPEATRAPIEELSAQEQETQRRDDAKDTLATIDDMLPKSKLSDADLAKVKQLRGQVGNFIAARKWAEASSAGTEALLKLGVGFPKC
jgi:transketolase